jgi:hypothetical protein
VARPGSGSFWHPRDESVAVAVAVAINEHDHDAVVKPWNRTSFASSTSSRLTSTPM